MQNRRLGRWKRFGNRLLHIVLSILILIQALGMPTTALAASAFAFQGYNQENVSGSTFTFSSKDALINGTTVSFTAATGKGEATGLITLNEEGADISTAVDLGGLEIDFSTDAKTTLEKVSDDEDEVDVASVQILFMDDSNTELGSVKLEKPNPAEAGSAALTSGASIPAGTREIYINLYGESISGSNTVVFSGTSLVIHDSSAPSCSFEYEDSWTNQPVDVRINAADSDSGLAGIYLNGVLKSTTSPYDLVVSSNNTTLSAYSMDNAGKKSDVQTIHISKIDTTKPAKPASLGLSTTEWTNQGVTLILPPLSTSTGAPDHYIYKTSSSDWSILPDPFVFSNNGVTTIYVAVQDEAGNYSDSLQANARIDTLAPVIDSLSSAVSSGSCRVDLTYHEEGLSGIKSVLYAKGTQSADYFTTGGTAITGGTFTVSEGGDYTICVLDNAGNAAIETKTLSTAPVLGNISDIEIDEDTPYNVSLNVRDAETKLESLTITATTDNTTLLPDIVVQQDATGASLDIKPGKDLNGGPANVTVSVSDSENTVKDTFAVTVRAVNDPPSAADDENIQLEEDSSVLINVLANDLDSADPSDTLSILDCSKPLHGTAMPVLGKIRYTPNENYVGTDTFSYTVSDGHGGTATADVFLTVTNVNDDPVALDDTASVSEDGSVSIPVLANDTDIDLNVPDAHETMTISDLKPGANGSTSQVNGEVVYTPNANFFGTDRFTYTITDLAGRSATATVLVTIAAVADAPVFKNLNATYSINEDSNANEIVFAIDDVETPADSLMLQASSLTTTKIAQTGITVSGLANEQDEVKLILTPVANQFGEAEIRLSLGDGFVTVQETIVVTIVNVNDAPKAVVDTVSFEEDSKFVDISISDLLANDTDLEGDAILFEKLLTQPGSGSIVQVDANTLRYTPVADFDGETSFTYSITDRADSTTATCKLVATGLNDAPEIAFQYDTATTTEDTRSAAIPFTIQDRETAASDLVLIASSGDTSLVAPGGFTITNNENGTGTLEVQPQPDAHGTLIVTLTVSDGEANVYDTIALTIDPAPDAPVGENDEVYVHYSGAYTFGVLGNDHDVDGDVLKIDSFSATGLPGSLTLDAATQQFTYVPAIGENGNVTFTYVASDSVNKSSATMVTLHVVSVTHDPVVSTINSRYVQEDGTISGIAFSVSDEDVGDTFDVTVSSADEKMLVADEDHAVVKSLGSGNYTLSLTPVADSSGQVSVTVTVTDKAGNVGATTFTLHILGQNDAPVAVDDVASLDEDGSLELNLLGNDSDADKDQIWVTTISTPSNGYLTRTIDKIFYTPYAQWHGTETLTYAISDGRATDSATLALTVQSVNDEPIAWDDYVTLVNESGAKNESINVLHNDRDPDGDTVYTYQIETQALYGTAVVNANGTISYKRDKVSELPNGADSFTYQIIDRANRDAADKRIATATVHIGEHFSGSLYTYGQEVNCLEDCDPFEIALDVSNPNKVDYSITINTPCTLGTLTVSQDKADTLVFRPNANAYGSQTITYTVADAQNKESDTGTIWLTVYPVNDAPKITSAPTSVTTQEDATTPASFDVTFEDLDCASSDLHFYIYTKTASTSAPVIFQTRYSTEPITNGKTVTVHTLANVNGNATIVVGVSDGFTFTEKTIPFTVTPQDDAPVVNNINRTIREDSNVRFAALPSDAELDGDDIALSVDTPSHGTATLRDDDTILYTPNANFFGTDTFHITAQDVTTDAKTTTALVTIVVQSVNDQPIIRNLSYYQTKPEDTQIVVPLNVSDVDNDMTSKEQYQFQSDNTDLVDVDNISIAHDTGDGMKITVKPAANASGTALITVVASDGFLSATSAFLLKVTPVNDPPSAAYDEKTVEEAVSNGRETTPPKTSDTMNLTANDTDVEGGTLRIVAITNVKNGTVVNAANGSVTVTAKNSDSVEAVTFDYTVMDPGGETASASAKMIITPKNDPPRAADDSATIDEDAMLTKTVLDNDYDPENEALSIVGVSDPDNGTASYTANSVTYQPDSNYNGQDSFVYTVSDASGATSTATVFITIRPLNDAPKISKYPADSGEWTMDEDTPKSFDFDVSDAESPDSNLIIQISSDKLNLIQTSQIQLSTNESGYKTIYVVPNANANGTVNIDFSVSDGLATTTVVYPITIASINDNPVVTPMTLEVIEETPFDATATATDADGDGVTFSIVEGHEPLHGKVVLNADGSFTYTPNDNYNGTDRFEVAADDGKPVNHIGTEYITVHVQGKNDLPVAQDDTININEDTATSIDVLSNDLDADKDYGDKLTVLKITTAPTKGTAVIQDNTVLYTPALDQNGTDSFSYLMADKDGKSDSADVTVNIAPVNDAPAGGNDRATTDEDTPISINVLINDDVDETTNPGLEQLTIVSTGLQQPTHGTVAIDEGGQGITYTPNPNYFSPLETEPDVFYYTVRDSGNPAQEATFSVAVRVRPVNDPPTLKAATADFAFLNVEMDEDTAYGPISFNVFDEEDAEEDLTVTITSNNSVLLPVLSATPNASGACSFSIQPNGNKVGDAAITVSVKDSAGESVEKSFTLKVKPVNDLPQAKNDAYYVPEGGTIIRNVLINDDLDTDSGNGGDTLTLLGLFLAPGDSVVPSLTTRYGTAEVRVIDNQLVYTHTAITADRNSYSESFQYKMQDADGNTSSATVQVTITPVKDPPQISNIPNQASMPEDQDGGTGNISFTVTDEEDDDDNLAITCTSSNLTLVPLANIIVTNPDITIDTTGSQRKVQVIPAKDQFGTATIELTVTDSDGSTAKDTFTITVTPVNDAPQNGNDSVEVNEDTSITINVLTNDDVDLLTNPESEHLMIDAVTKPANGTATISEDKQKITYQPDKDFFTKDGSPETFTYTVYDKSAPELKVTFTVTVKVKPVNDAPTIDYRGAELYSVNEGEPVNNILFYVDDIDNNTDKSAGDVQVTVAVKSSNAVLLKDGIQLTNGDGKDWHLSLQPNGEWNGTTTLTITATDPGKLSAKKQFVLEVNNINKKPVAVADAPTVPEDAVTSVNVLSNDTDADLITNPKTETLFVNSVSPTSDNASVSLSLDEKSVVIHPKENFNGTFTFVYTARDVARAVSDPVECTVTVSQVNDAPAPKNDTAEVNEDGTVQINVLNLDTDVDQTAGINAHPELEVLSASISEDDLKDPEHGTISMLNNVVTYDPNDDFNGTDTFEYYCKDGEAQTKATVTVTINQVNDNPVAVSDTSSVDEDHTASKDVIVNDTDVDTLADQNKAPSGLQSLTDLSLKDGSAVLTSASGSGTVSQSGNTITFVPKKNWFGTATIQYTVQDKFGGSANGVYEVIVNSVNDLPVFATPPADMNLVEDSDSGTGTFVVSDVETQASGLGVTFVSSSNPSLVDGSGVTISAGTDGNRTVTINPKDNQNGSTTIRLKVQDADKGSNEITFVVTVSAVNDDPTAGNIDVTMAEDTTRVIDVAPSIGDVDIATNADKITVSVQEGNGASHGVYSVSGTKITYTPSTNFNGTDQITYTVTDDAKKTANGVIALTISQVNDPPAPKNDTAEVNEDGTVQINVLNLDTDVDQTAGINAHPELEVLSASISEDDLKDPEHGKILILNNVVTYDPKDDFNGTDTFEYYCKDGEAQTKATVTVTINQVNDNPVAQADTTTTYEDTAVTYNVLANDTDVDTDPAWNFATPVHTKSEFAIAKIELTGTINGTASFSGNSITFTPKLDYVGTQTISYEMRDGHGGTSASTLSVKIGSEDDSPVAGDDVMSTTEDNAVTINVLTNDQDADIGDTLRFDRFTDSVSSLPGTFTTNANGSVTFTPKANYNGSFQVDYYVVDSTNLTDVGTISVSVSAVNDQPVAEDTSVTTQEDLATTIDVAGLISDADITTNEDSIRVSIAAGDVPAHGSYKLDGTQITYTPAKDFNGKDQIVYTVTDSKGLQDTGTISITVSAVNDKPVTKDDSATTKEDTPVTIDVLVNDSDVDTTTGLNESPAAKITLSSVGSAAHGTVKIAGGKITYEPNANFNGTDRFTYTVSDGTLTETGSVSVSISQENDAIVAKDDEASTPDEDPVTIDVLLNDTDVDTDETNNLAELHKRSEFELTAVGPAHNGTTKIVSGKILYTPEDRFSGKDSFTYTVSDGHGESRTAKVTVTVLSVNDAPRIVQVPKPVDGTKAIPPDPVPVTWTSFDIDGDKLTYTLEYYDGKNWLPVVSGLAKEEYSFNIPATLASTNGLKFRVTANDGSLTSDYGYSGAIKVDKDAPTGSVVAMRTADGRAYTAGTWTNQNVIVQASSAADVSAVRYYYSMDGATEEAADSMTVTNGVHTVNVTARDEFKNQTALGGYLARVDKLAPAVPEIRESVSGASVLVLLTLQTDPGGSGNDTLILPDGTSQRADTTLQYAATRNGTYSFTLIDIAGNRRTFSYTVTSADTSKPQITYTSGAYRVGTKSQTDITIVLSFLDAESQITARGYQLNASASPSGTYRNYDGSIVISNAGTYYIHAFAKNAFGITAYETFGPFVLEQAPQAGETPAPQPVVGNVVVTTQDIPEETPGGTVAIRLPGKEWSETLTLEGVEPGDYLVEVMDAEGNIRTTTIHVTARDIYSRSLRGGNATAAIIALSVLAAAAILLLLLFAGYNVMVTVVNVPFAEEKKIRAMRRIMFKRTEFVIKLEQKHVQGGKFAKIKIAKHLTRKLRGDWVIVQIQGVEVLREQVPEDANEAFRRKITLE